MKNEQTAVIKNMEFLLKELHKEWERPGEVKSSVRIPYDKVEAISRKLNGIVYETQQSSDSDGLTFKQSIAKSKQCYVLLRIMRKIVKGKDKCERQSIDAEFVIELDGEESIVLSKSKRLIFTFNLNHPVSHVLIAQPLFVFSNTAVVLPHVHRKHKLCRGIL